jgi:hypothetical protein
VGQLQAIRAELDRPRDPNVAPINGFVMYAVPNRFVQGSSLFLALRAFDASGKQIDQRGLGRSW